MRYLVAKLKFLGRRARPDIQITVPFMYTLVEEPDTGDWRKLTQGCNTFNPQYLPLTMEGKNLKGVNWWVDMSFAVHPDMRIHTGGMLLFIQGAIYTTST